MTDEVKIPEETADSVDTAQDTVPSSADTEGNGERATAVLKPHGKPRSETSTITEGDNKNRGVSEDRLDPSSSAVSSDGVREANPVDVLLRGKHPMETMLRNFAGVSLPKIGEIVEGSVLEKKGTRLFIDLGYRGIGLVFGREYHAAQDIIKNLNPGDPVSAKVVLPDNDEGYIELSLKEAGEERRWTDLAKMTQEGAILELPVLEANRGGLILELKNVKGFLPASQLSAKNYPRVEGGDKEKVFQELQKLVGQTLKVKILFADVTENKLIFTEKELDQAALREALSKHKVGDEVEGEITGVVDFGAFMKFDEATGLEGLIHISEIDWTLIGDPRDVLKPGDKVKAKIINIQSDKVSLSLKALKEDPWVKLAEKYKKGDNVRAKVTKFNPFGAFAEFDSQVNPVKSLGSEAPTDGNQKIVQESTVTDVKTSHTSNGVQGLVHISEFGTEAKMKEELELGQEYDFKVLLLDPKEHRMSLGMIREEKKQNPDTHQTQIGTENPDAPKAQTD